MISPPLAGGDRGERENENLFTLTPTLSPAYRQAGIKVEGNTRSGSKDPKKMPFGQKNILSPKGV
jgi:hypothetical protein